MNVNENLLEYLESYEGRELQKGFDLFDEHRFGITLLYKKRKCYTVEVPSQSGKDRQYLIKLNLLKNYVDDDCDCPAYEEYEQCKHCIAAALFLLEEECGYEINDLEELGLNEDDSDSAFANQLAVINTHLQNKKPPLQTNTITQQPGNNPWHTFTLKDSLKNQINALSGEYWLYYDLMQKIKLENFDESSLHWTFLFKEKKDAYQPEFRYDRKKTFSYRCNCSLKSHYSMCLHVRAGFE
ncbi:MAG: hypothetical protein ABR503_17115, partial [Chitinophagaceae bacterium]